MDIENNTHLPQRFWFLNITILIKFALIEKMKSIIEILSNLCYSIMGWFK